MPLQDFPVNQAMASKTGIHNWVVGVQRPDRAEPLWLLCNASQIRDEMDNLVQVVVTFIDITERKQAEAHSRESEQRRESEQADALEAQRQSALTARSLMEDALAARTRAEEAAATLDKQLDELRRWQQVTLNRESRILSLKKEINDLLAAHGQPPRYPSALDEGAQK